jgi:hypothetical protein
MRTRCSRAALAAGTALVLLPVGAGVTAPAFAGNSTGAERLGSASAPALTQLALQQKGKGNARYGRTVVLEARLSSQGTPLAGKPVSLYRAAVSVATATTNAQGAAIFRLEARQTGTYEARFAPSSPGDQAAYQAAVSKPLDVVVRSVVKLGVSSELRAGRKALAVSGVALRVTARVTPYAAGTEAVIEVVKHGRRIKSQSATLRKVGSSGSLGLTFKPRKRGSYLLRVRQKGAGKGAHMRLLVVRPRARPGSRGRAVRALQRELAALGYATPVNGHFGGSTARAVLAFRKVNGMSRTTGASRAIFKKLEKGAGAFRVRYPKAGKHVEFDWSHQVVVLANGARPVRTLPASSGKPSTPTVFGHYRFYSKTPGFNQKGMYYSNYFVGGYAIHGYKDVPTFAASHGCIRIPIPSAISVYRWISIGDQIFVYR